MQNNSNLNNLQILVLDFGSQYTQLIARRLREYGVYTEIVPYFEKLDSIKAKNPKGIILSGGPASVYEEGAYKPDSTIFTLGIPILGICYGLHLIAYHFGGKVIRADAQEFGKAVLEILEPQARNLGQQRDCSSNTRTILATPRTILREYSQKDFKTLCTILGDSQTMAAWGQGFETQETQEWLDKQIKSYQQNGFGIWAIIDKKTGEIIGNAGLNYATVYAHKTSQEQPQNIIEIAYLLRREFWGKGYATECANACMDYAFSVLGLEKIYCFIKEDNVASIKVAQRLGMKKVNECVKSYKGKKLQHLVFESQKISYDLLNKSMFQHVVKLWEGSVRSSHHFLNEQDILSIQREVKKALKGTQYVIVAKQKKTLLGFIGIEKNCIEMLFVSPLIFRQGIGKALIKEALKRFLNSYQTIKVDCNEQNPQALGFYQRLGFEIVGKSPTDSVGRDFPIVHLEVRTDKLSSILLYDTLHYAIIPARKQDLQAILALQQSAFIDEAKRVDKMDIEPLTQNIESIKHEFKQKLFLKCVQNGKIIGSVRGYQENETTYIGKLFVDSAYRKKGIGSALVETLCAMLPAKRYEIFTSEKSFENIALYQKLGFMEYKRESVQGFPVKAVFMEKVAVDSSLAHVSPLFKNVKQNSTVWMSHADKVEAIPQGFIELAKSGNTPYCAIADLRRKVYALQFHPEVVHSECGGQILRNFAVEICGSDTSWNMRTFAENEIAKLRAIVESEGINKTTMRRCDWATDKDETARKLYENYHDTEWGVPLHEDRKLFEFLVLEAMQAGLSWITILKKREAFRAAFDDFDPKIVARYDEPKIQELLNNEGIIRNRLKIESAIMNAKLFLEIQKEFGSFDKYIWDFVEGKPIVNHFASMSEIPTKTPLSDKISKDLQKRGFKFVGSTIMYAYMQAIGMVNDHLMSCPCREDSKHNHNKWRQDFGDKNGVLQDEAMELPQAVMTEAEAKQSPFLAQKPTPSKVLCAVSGGVDSSVVAALLYRAIGENLIPVFVDTGLLRKGEREAVEKMFMENLKVPLITADASALFLQRLKGVIDPEKKRKIIGETFIEVFEKEAKKYNQKGEIKFLAQGTLYPDVIESVSVKGPSKTIKSHHNVGGLPEWMQFELIEPLRELFKDEVRALGRELGMPESMLMRHPFPGPGLAIRIMGEVNKRDLDLLREADSIFIEELQKQGYYDKVWQAFCVLLNVHSVGVMGDNRTYDNTICVRAVEAIDGMTATFAHLPHDFLESVSNRIINEVEGINRVVYDITSKPPGTIEWE